MLDDLQNFKIANAEAQKQMEDMLERLEVIRDQHLGPAEQGLTRAPRTSIKTPPTQSPAQPPPGLTTRPCNQPTASRTVRSETLRTRPRQVQGPTPKKNSPDTHASSKVPDATRNVTKGRIHQAKQPKANPPRAATLRQNPPRGATLKANLPRGATRQGGSVEGKTQSPRLQGMRPQKPDSDLGKSALAEAKTNQKAIADELQKMLDSLSEFETYRGVVKDAQELLKQQEQAMKQTAEVAA